MVDSSKVPPATAQQAAVKPTGEQVVKLVTLPDALQNNARARRLEGEVVRQNPDGSTRIRTAEGTIDVQVRGRPPQPGQPVQVDVPPGRPPRQATLRPAPAQTTQPPSPPVQNAPPPPVQTTTPARPLPALSTPPAPLPPAANVPPPVTAPLPEGSTVRLTPLAPAPAQQAVQQTLSALSPQPASVTRAAFSANLIAQKAPDNLVNQLLTIIRPAPVTAAPPVPALTFQPPAALTPPPVPGATFLSQPVSPPSPAGQPAQPAFHLSPPGQPATAALPSIQNGAALPFQPVRALLIPALTSATSPPAPLKALASIDVLVTKITLPGAQLVPPPSSPGQATPTPAMPAQPANPIQAGAAGSLLATVTAATPQGQPVVSLSPLSGQPAASFILQFPASNLPIGAQLHLIPGPGQPAILPAPGGSTVTGPAPSLAPALPPLQALLGGARWPVLTEMLQSLQQSAPDLAQALARALPSPANPRAMPPAALLFLAAAKAGDLSLWLGDKKIETLQRLGRSPLLGRLTGDGQQMARLAAEPLPSSDWRAVPLPMFWDQEIQKITLYFKRDDESAGRENNEGEQTRFIFDLSLTRMGDVQIDGLMRGARLDLIVRTQNPFSAPMQAHMKQLYRGAIEDVSLTGDLSFQGDPRHWVNILPQETHYGAHI